jgi:hypothetical protein
VCDVRKTLGTRLADPLVWVPRALLLCASRGHLAEVNPQCPDRSVSASLTKPHLLLAKPPNDPSSSASGRLTKGTCTLDELRPAAERDEWIASDVCRDQGQKQQTSYLVLLGSMKVTLVSTGGASVLSGHTTRPLLPNKAGVVCVVLDQVCLPTARAYTPCGQHVMRRGASRRYPIFF